MLTYRAFRLCSPNYVTLHMERYYANTILCLTGVHGDPPSGKKDKPGPAMKKPNARSSSKSAPFTHIGGIGSKYAELLRRAGVESVDQLAKQDSHLLVKKLTSENSSQRPKGRVPSRVCVKAWIKKTSPSYRFARRTPLPEFWMNLDAISTLLEDHQDGGDRPTCRQQT